MGVRGKTPVVVGVTVDYERQRRPSGKEEEIAFVYPRYFEAISRVGAVPLLLPPDPLILPHLSQLVDAVLLTGGDDLDPYCYGEEPRAPLKLLHPRRQSFELELLKTIDQEQIPALGICFGAQLINVHRGGSLIQDLATLDERLGRTHKGTQGETAFHEVFLDQSSWLYQVLNEPQLWVCSFHHQAVKQVGKGLRVVAWASDGIVEALEAEDHPFLVGLQWHLEWEMEKQPASLPLWHAFVEKAREFSPRRPMRKSRFL